MYPRSSPKKTRHALVLSAVIIFLGEILAGFLIDRAPLGIRFPDAATIIRAAHQRNRSPDIVFFGSSRTQAQVNAQIVEQRLATSIPTRPPSVFNAGISYGEPVVFDFLALKLLEAGVRPKVAVIEVSPETVSRKLLALDVHLTRQFSGSDALESLSHMVYSGGFSRLLSTRLIPVYRFRSEFRHWAVEVSGLQFLLCCAVDKTEPQRTHARDEANKPLADRLREQTGIIRDRLRYFQISGMAPRALERLIARYKTLGVTTILLGVSISSPSRREYVSAIDAAFLEYMSKLGQKYGVYFFDYRDRVPDEFFRTIYYTNQQGTEYVSGLIADEVVGPAWQKRSSGAAPSVR